MVIRLLELARAHGHRYHFFASGRVLRAFPASAEAILNEGHDLDWFCKHLEGGEARREEAWQLFGSIGHTPRGFSLKSNWAPESDLKLEGLEFLSAPLGPAPDGVKVFAVETRPDREASRAGLSVRTWSDATKSLIRDAASRGREVTVAVRPQVLAKFDPRLSHVREIIELAEAVGLPIRSLRQVLDT